MFRELSFLVLGTGVEEFLEGYQIFLPCDIGLPNNFAISLWGIKNFCHESFDTGIVKKLGKFPYWDKNFLMKRIRVSLNNGISAYPKPAKLPHVVP